MTRVLSRSRIELLRFRRGKGYPRVNYSEHNDLLMSTSKISSRMSPLELESAPSSINLGDIPVHVHAGGEPRVVDGSSTVNPTDWTIVSILSSCLITRPKLSPNGGRSKCGKY